jgi:hypothetical protein
MPRQSMEQHHEEVVKGIAEQLKPVLEKSPQGIYIYLDDAHKICNKRFADMLGYGSVSEWVEMEAPLSDVLEEDQGNVVAAYENASEKMIASELGVRIKNVKNGKIIKTRVILAPIAFSGHIFVMHFISQV